MDEAASQVAARAAANPVAVNRVAVNPAAANKVVAEAARKAEAVAQVAGTAKRYPVAVILGRASLGLARIITE